MSDFDEKMKIGLLARERAVHLYNKPNHKIVGHYPTANVTSFKNGVAEGYITLLFKNETSVCKSYFRASKQNGEYVIQITSDFND